MSNTADRLYKATFPTGYADILMETLAITPDYFLSIKDALYHFRHLDDDQVGEVVQAIADRIETDETDEATRIHAILAKRREIAVIWCIEDVQAQRPDLTDDQAWEVLQATKRYHDATIGINWEVLECHAQILFGFAPETDEAGEA